MTPSFRLIAREAKQSQSATRLAKIAASRFAILATAAFLLTLTAPASAADGDIDQGRETYQDVCAACHGPDMANSGTLSPDLRKFPKDDFARFKRTVLGGKGSAMPAWAGKLSDEDVANLWAYVASGG